MKKILSSFIIVFVMSSVMFLSVGLDANAKQTKQVFNQTNVTKVQVKANALNVRSGPGTAYGIVSVVYRGQKLKVFGEAWDWYAVQLPDYTIGYVSGNYAKPYNPSYTPSPQTPSTPNSSPKVTSEMQRMLDLINQERAEAGVHPLEFDYEVNNAADAKAQDMVQNNYFSHTSPVYGSPFDMLRDFKVSFRTAGENIAGNSSVDAAHKSLMNSAGHRKNILNSKYDYIGIGIKPSNRYGKVFVQMFIGR